MGVLSAFVKSCRKHYANILTFPPEVSNISPMDLSNLIRCGDCPNHASMGEYSLQNIPRGEYYVLSSSHRNQDHDSRNTVLATVLHRLLEQAANILVTEHQPEIESWIEAQTLGLLVETDYWNAIKRLQLAHSVTGSLLPAIKPDKAVLDYFEESRRMKSGNWEPTSLIRAIRIYQDTIEFTFCRRLTLSCALPAKITQNFVPSQWEYHNGAVELDV